ncbi:MAG: homocysteine S-methyltransferase family protein [Christensenellaceae bacterium]
MLKDKVAQKALLYDGSKGVMLQLKGLSGGESAEEWNLTNPEKVCEVYNSYIDAGADMIQTNTFCANEPSLKNHHLDGQLYEINFEGAHLALECAKGKGVMVAASVGPTGLFFEPAGDLTFEMAVHIFKQQLRPIFDAGVRIVNFETFTDLNEMRAAMTAAQEIGEFEIISSMTFDNGRTMSGNTPKSCAVVCSAMGAVLVGANCSGGPESLLLPISDMHEVVNTPLSVKPNAGLPEMESGTAVFKQSPQDFASLADDFLQRGVRLIGGCCGSGPAHICALREALESLTPPPLKTDFETMLASPYEVIQYTANTKTAEMNVCQDSIIDGIKCGDYYCLMDAMPPSVQEADAVIVDFANLEFDFDMWKFVSTLTMFVRKPIILKTQSTQIAQAFLRVYSGRAGLIMPHSDFPKYGAVAFDEVLKVAKK